MAAMICRKKNLTEIGPVHLLKQILGVKQIWQISCKTNPWCIQLPAST
jgi:hypothetical protein